MNDAVLCSYCESVVGLYCKFIIICLMGDHRCRRYCCDTNDCGSSFTCIPMVVYGIENVGICAGEIDSSGMGAGCSDVLGLVVPSGGACL